VVVALDDRLLASALAAALQTSFRVSGPHHDTEAAEQALAERPVAVAIVDVALAGVSIVDRLPQWRTRWPATRFVVCEHPLPEALVVASELAGVVGVISHDVSADELATALRTLCEGGEWSLAARPDRLLYPVEPLSAAESRVLRGLRQGMSQAALARHLGRSGKTIEQQVSALRRKFAIPRGERVDWARLAEESD
jgi:DNA-binding NarL/FixJ family response regulator